MIYIKNKGMTMKKILKRELKIYIIIFVVLTLGMHYKEWFSHPFEHISSLPTSQFGTFHPIFFSFGVYLIVLIMRGVIVGFRKLIKR